MNKKILEVKNLSVSFNTYAGEVKALRDVSFSVDRGETLAIVGESGSGKSVTVQSIIRLIPMPPGEIKGGEILFENEDLIKVSDERMRELRGGRIGMIFQDPMTSLNPTIKVGKQIMEGILIHKKVSKDEAKKRAIEMLEKNSQYNNFNTAISKVTELLTKYSKATITKGIKNRFFCFDFWDCSFHNFFKTDFFY